MDNRVLKLDPVNEGDVSLLAFRVLEENKIAQPLPNYIGRR